MTTDARRSAGGSRARRSAGRRRTGGGPRAWKGGDCNRKEANEKGSEQTKKNSIFSSRFFATSTGSREGNPKRQPKPLGCLYGLRRPVLGLRNNLAKTRCNQVAFMKAKTQNFILNHEGVAILKSRQHRSTTATRSTHKKLYSRLSPRGEHRIRPHTKVKHAPWRPWGARPRGKRE